jgi:hypothetical protein
MLRSLMTGLAKSFNQIHITTRRVIQMTFITKQNAGLLKSVRSWGVLGLLLALVVLTVGYGPQSVSLGQEPRQAQPVNPFKVGQKFVFSATYTAQTGTPPRVATVDSDSGSISYEVTAVAADTATFRVINTFRSTVAGRVTIVTTEPVLYIVSTAGQVLQTNVNTEDPTARGTTFQDVRALNLGFELFAFNLSAGRKIRIGSDDFTVGPKPVEIIIGGVKYQVWEATRQFKDDAISMQIVYQYDIKTGMLVQHTGQVDFLSDVLKKEFGGDRVNVTIQLQMEAPSLLGGMAMDTRPLPAACAELGGGTGGIWAGDHIPSGTSSGTFKCFARHLGVEWRNILQFFACVAPKVAILVAELAAGNPNALSNFWNGVKACLPYLPVNAIQTASQHCKWPKFLY